MAQCSIVNFEITIYCFILNSSVALIAYVEAEEENSDLLEYPVNDFLELLNYLIVMFMK